MRPARQLLPLGTRRTCALLLLLLLPLPACKQGQGERCQVDSDCEEGFVCCVREVDRALGGTCQPENACELTPVTDGGADTGTTDRGVDAKVPAADKGADRSTAHDGALHDGKIPDGKTPDSATPDSAGTADGPAPDATAADLAAEVGADA